VVDGGRGSHWKKTKNNSAPAYPTMRALNEQGLRAQLKTSVFISVTGNYYLVIVCTQNFSKTVNKKKRNSSICLHRVAKAFGTFNPTYVCLSDRLFLPVLSSKC